MNLLKNALLYDDGSGSFRRGGLTVENGRITSFEERPDAEDAKGMLLVPGLVDLHTHGRAGYDFLTADAEGLEKMKRAYLRSGVTTVIPTLASGTLEEWLAAAKRIADAGFCGIHFEGRYLNPKKRGAHAAGLLSPLDPDELDLLAKACGNMRVHITLAPELRGGEEFVKKARSLGFTVGIGHTDASYEEASEALQWGADRFAHVYNAMSPLHHRDPGAVGAAMLSDAWAELICDGFHLHPAAVKIMERMKSSGRIVLITDSMEGTGCPDGEYSIAGEKVFLRNGCAVNEEGAIAGSTLDLLDGVKNYARFCGVSFGEALACATVNPARAMRLDGVGSLRVGQMADLLLLDPEKNLLRVYSAGERIYQATERNDNQ